MGGRDLQGSKGSKPNASNALGRTRDNKEGKHEGRGGDPAKIGQELTEVSVEQAIGGASGDTGKTNMNSHQTE